MDKLIQADCIRLVEILENHLEIAESKMHKMQQMFNPQVIFVQVMFRSCLDNFQRLCRLDLVGCKRC